MQYASSDWLSHHGIRAIIQIWQHPAGYPKQGPISFVLNKVLKLRVLSLTGYVLQDFFCPKQGQSLKLSVAHLYPNIDRVPSTPLQGTFFATRRPLGLEIKTSGTQGRPTATEGFCGCEKAKKVFQFCHFFILSLDILKDNTIHSSFQGCKALNLACERGFFCQKWYEKAKGLDLRVEPLRLKLC